MMSNNKILTVSYGTFSCTLEGFEDSFGTMKAIAEYFRDLAADDRYFGAEPPQPDAEMLARIAQKDVSRRVKATETDGTIMLSAVEEPAKELARPAQREPENVSDNSDLGNAALATAATAGAVLAADLEADSTTEDPADARKARRAAKARAAAAAAQQSAQVPLETQDQDAEENDIVPGQPDADVEAFFAESQTATAAFEDEDDTTAEAATAAVVEDPKDTDQSQSDSIAAKLERIRAVVAQQDDDVDEEDDYLEDEHAFDADIETSSLPASAAVDAADEDLDLAEAEDEDDETDDIDAILNRLKSRNNQREQSAAAAPAQETTAPSKAPAEPARVIKVQRETIESALRSGKVKEVTQDDDAQTAPKSLGLDDLAPARNAETSLSAEDEADLVRELAKLELDIEAEKSDGADDTPVAAELEKPIAPRSKAALPQIDAGDDADVSRLLAEADQQMGEPESANRRDAFTHLRAAVASKNADDAMGTGTPEADTDDAYRSDLAEVVKPRRPTASGTRRVRPNEARPAPLKLVAEQRVDVGQPSNEGPVRPRRVAAAADTSDPSGADSFAEFAAEMGATKLPDLLEAAAAYMSFVEGRKQFSRPQLMTKVRQVGGDGDFSREDGLRSFGQLLRTGKIEKIKGGRFTVSEDIGFRPDERAAG